MTHNERVLALLRDGREHDHHELYALNVIAHSRIAELRRRGYVIQQRRETGPDGDARYIYRLVSEPSLSEAPETVTPLAGHIRAGASESEVALARPDDESTSTFEGPESEEQTSLNSRRGVGMVAGESPARDIRPHETPAPSALTLFDSPTKPRKVAWA